MGKRRKGLDDATNKKYRYETESELNKDERAKTENDLKEMRQWSLQIEANMERELCVAEGMNIELDKQVTRFQDAWGSKNSRNQGGGWKKQWRKHRGAPRARRIHLGQQETTAHALIQTTHTDHGAMTVSEKIGAGWRAKERPQKKG